MMPIQIRARTSPHISLAVAAFLGGLLLSAPAAAWAQKPHQATIQIEVGDSVGLPLPDAKVEVFTFMEGGVFWEWIPLGSSPLPDGINLLRFSYPGYRAETFSVPVREASTLSLRVRLEPEHDTTHRSDIVEARAVRAVGLAVEGRAHTDVVGRRRVLEHATFEKETVPRFGPLMRRARNTELTVVPATGGTFTVYGRSGSGAKCPLQVMINGDRRRVLPFDAFDRMFSIDELEAIEIFPSGSSLPLPYDTDRAGCGMMIAWFRTL
jgi:hypothetical protein